ncbi:MAG: GldG family protein [Clostridiales bacterium]|nr:GldG family protein [Clostridiales bacterium]
MKFDFKSFRINTKTLKYGSISTLFTIFFIAALLLSNILVDFATTRFSLKLDLTEEGLYQLDPATQELLSSLEDDVTIYILATENSMKKNTTANSILETIYRYNTNSGGRVKYQFIDPNKNPAFFEQYKTARNAGSRALLVVGPYRDIVLKSDEFIWTYQNSDKFRFYGIEEKISSAILFVTSKDISRAALVTGHEGKDPKALASIIKGNNFEYVSINLTTTDIPDNVNNLIISAPTVDFSAEEIKKIDDFLKKDGKNLYVFWSVETPHLEVLERYLVEWGISFGDAAVYDSKEAFQRQDLIIPGIVNNDVTAEMNQGDRFIIMPGTVPINILWNESGYTRVLPVLQSGTSSYAKVFNPAKPITDLNKAQGDVIGPFTVAAVSERATQKAGEYFVSRVFSFGTSDIAAEEIAGVPSAYNVGFLTEIVDYANPKTNVMEVMPKMTEDHDLNITKGQVDTIRWILIILPILILVAGLVVFFVRRHK